MVICRIDQGLTLFTAQIAQSPVVFLQELDLPHSLQGIFLDHIPFNNLCEHVLNGGDQPVTTTLACGTWAGNMSSDNINWRHFLNYTWVALPIEEHVPTDEELFGDYLRKWGRGD